MNEELKKAATKGRGKRDQAQKALWIDSFTDVIRTDPCGTVIIIGADGKPTPTKRAYTKKTAWAFEFIGKTGEWEYSTVMNLDKMDGAVRFTHTLKWCMDKLNKEQDMFHKGTFDRDKFRLHNLVDDNILLLAILIKRVAA